MSCRDEPDSGCCICLLIQEKVASGSALDHALSRLFSSRGVSVRPFFKPSQVAPQNREQWCVHTYIDLKGTSTAEHVCGDNIYLPFIFFGPSADHGINGDLCLF